MSATSGVLSILALRDDGPSVLAEIVTDRLSALLLLAVGVARHVFPSSTNIYVKPQNLALPLTQQLHVVRRLMLVMRTQY